MAKKKFEKTKPHLNISNRLCCFTNDERDRLFRYLNVA